MVNRIVSGKIYTAGKLTNLTSAVNTQCYFWKHFLVHPCLQSSISTQAGLLQFICYNLSLHVRRVLSSCPHARNRSSTSHTTTSPRQMNSTEFIVNFKFFFFESPNQFSKQEVIPLFMYNVFYMTLFYTGTFWCLKILH